MMHNNNNSEICLEHPDKEKLFFCEINKINYYR